MESDATGLQPVSFRKGRGHAPRLSAPYVPGRRSERFWSEAERQILRDSYADKGMAWCAAQLPHRSRQSIYTEAQKLGLRRSGIAARRGRRSDAEQARIDDAIREAWPTLAGRGGVSDLAGRLGIDRWIVSQRARKLGLTVAHRKEPPWSAAEIALLPKVPLHDPDRCAEIFRAHGYNRSPTAIRVAAKRQGLSRRYRETLSATQAAAILGVDGKTVTVWCLEGRLQAAKRQTLRLPQQGGQPWSITPQALRDFVVENVAHLDIRKVDKVAFVALLTGHLDRKEAAAE